MWNSKSTEWPHGQSNVVVSDLLEEFVPEGVMGLLQQRKDLMKIKMKKHKNPKTLFSPIIAIENIYRDRTIPLSRYATLLDKLPYQYHTTLHNLQRLAEKDGKKEAEWKDIRKQTVKLYRRSYHESGSRQGKELSLFTGYDSSQDSDKKSWKGKRKSQRNNNKGKSNISCYHCGKKGHMRRHCSELHGKKKGKCNHCVKTGHKESECWDKYPEKKSKWMKDKDKSRQDTDTDDSDDEVTGIVSDGELTLMALNT